jgi:hypothetical protein
VGSLASRKKVIESCALPIELAGIQTFSHIFRKEPPTNEEVMKNYAIMQLKKKNAAELDEKYGKPVDQTMLPKEEKGMSSFPSYKEYEINPSGKTGGKD